MRNLEHELVRLTYEIEAKRHPERELAKQLSVLAMVMHANRDPRSFAIWLNGLARR